MYGRLSVGYGLTYTLLQHLYVRIKTMCRLCLWIGLNVQYDFAPWCMMSDGLRIEDAVLDCMLFVICADLYYAVTIVTLHCNIHQA